MKVIDGKNAILGRLASYVAKEALKGEKIVILNCEQMIITGKKKNIEENFEEKWKRGGSSQKGPIHHKVSEKIVKRTIRGMLPNHREGRGKKALKSIMCYDGVPKEFEEAKKITAGKGTKTKFIKIKELLK